MENKEPPPQINFQAPSTSGSNTSTIDALEAGSSGSLYKESPALSEVSLTSLFRLHSTKSLKRSHARESLKRSSLSFATSISSTSGFPRDYTIAQALSMIASSSLPQQPVNTKFRSLSMSCVGRYMPLAHATHHEHHKHHTHVGHVGHFVGRKSLSLSDLTENMDVDL